MLKETTSKFGRLNNLGIISMSDRNEIANQIREIVAEHLGMTIEEIKDDTVLNETPDWSEMDAIDIVTDIESTLDVTFEDEDCKKTLSVPVLTDLVLKYQNKTSA